MVERRGNLAGDFSTRLQHFRSQLAREVFLDPDACWLGHFRGGDRLSVFHLSTPHSEGLGLRDDRTAFGHCSLHGARLFFERDDSPDRLSLSDSRKDPRGNPEAARSTKATTAAPEAAPRGHLPFASRGFDHGVGHPLLLLYDAKAPNGQSRYPRAHARGTC